MKGDQIGRDSAVALNQGILCLVEGAFGIEHSEKIRRAVGVQFVRRVEGFLARYDSVLQRTPAHLLSRIQDEAILHLLKSCQH